MSLEIKTYHICIYGYITEEDNNAILMFHVQISHVYNESVHLTYVWFSIDTID